MSLNIILHEPEIPANTGNIGRTCVAIGATLHLIEPLGFVINDKNLARAGMDYWKQLDVRTYLDWEDFCAKNPDARIWMATTKGRHVTQMSLMARMTTSCLERSRREFRKRFSSDSRSAVSVFPCRGRSGL